MFKDTARALQGYQNGLGFTSSKVPGMHNVRSEGFRYQYLYMGPEG